MTLMSVTSRIVRIVSGSVTRVIRCQALAPSTSVASLISRGMAWMAPMNRIIPKPMTFQVTDAMIAHVEQVRIDAQPQDRLVDQAEVEQDPC